ncbi:MAG TPA: serine hydrolase domain-containing protein [Gemmatimonadales bacterium]|jgi:CubicO group peptidase (beta-lactamase class C family)|nr:serine hydrolase domain-containing protein [Gemmatimonadales bacterium]
MPRLLFIFSLLFTGLLRAQQPDRWQPVRDSIRRQLVTQGVAAISVAVAKDGRILWEEGFGWANREKMIPATPNTMFSLASISKPITATGLMVLVQRGQVNLDRPANDYLGAGKLTGLAGNAVEATVRRVAGHMAGLPLHYQFFYGNEAIRPPSMDETIARYGILVSAPGETFRYSNLGFGIIDYIISRVSGQSYPDFMRTEVFVPLGLTHTSVDIGPGLEPFAAERYDKHQRPIPFYTFDHNGGSAIYSSAHDLVRFGMFHLKDHLSDQRAILADSTLDQMEKPNSARAFGTATYGIGWLIQPSDHGYRTVEHSGGMPGVQTALNLYPSENLAIVVLTNSSSSRPDRIAEDIAAIVLPRYGDSLRAERSRPKNRPARPAFTAPAELLGSWTGTLRTWQSSVPLTLTVQPDGNALVQVGDPAKSELEARGDKQLRALLNDAHWEDKVLSGRFAGTITTPDASRVAHTIAIELRLVGGKLRGQANAESGVDPVYFSLASYVELTRK